MCAIKEVKESSVCVCFFFFHASNFALSCQLSRMKAVPVYAVPYRGEVSLSPPQTDRSRLNIKLYIPVHTACLGSQTSLSHLIKQSSSSRVVFKARGKDKAK